MDAISDATFKIMKKKYIYIFCVKLLISLASGCVISRLMYSEPVIIVK